MSTQRAQSVLLFLVLAVNSTGSKFTELHTLTLAARSYAFDNKERASEPVHKVSLGATTSHTVTSDYLMIHGRIICRGTMGIAMRAICSRGSPASIIFRPVTLSEAANAIYVS